MLRWGVIALLVLVSVGWLVPLYFSVDCLLTWCNHEQMNAHGQHTFPYLAAAWDAFRIAGAWLGSVVLFWTTVLGWLLLGPSRR